MKITSRTGKPGVFIVVEGVDGCGKSTAIKLIKEQIQTQRPDKELVHLRLPGGSVVSEKIREILLTHPIPATAEVMLFVASHINTLEREIYPALDRGAIVLCDRFIDSTYAYQGYGNGHLEEVRLMHQEFMASAEPDYQIHIDAPLDLCLQRILARGNMDVFDAADLEIRTRRHEGMLELQKHRFEKNPMRYGRIQNASTMDELETRCIVWVRDWLGEQATQTPEPKVDFVPIDPDSVFRITPSIDPMNPFTFPPVQLELVSLADYLSVLRNRFNEGYMPSSTSDCGFNSKPTYCSKAAIAQLINGTDTYHFDNDWQRGDVDYPSKELLNIRDDAIYFALDTDDTLRHSHNNPWGRICNSGSLQFLTNLKAPEEETFVRTYDHSTKTYGDWMRWTSDKELGLNFGALKEQADNW